MNVAKSIPKDFPFCVNGESQEKCVVRVVSMRLVAIGLCIVCILFVVIYPTKHYNLSNAVVTIKGVQYTCKQSDYGIYNLFKHGQRHGTIKATNNNYEYTVLICNPPNVAPFLTTIHRH